MADVVGGLRLAGSIAIVFAGLWVARRDPWLGSAGALLGLAPLALLFFPPASILLWPLAAVAVVALAWRAGRRRGAMLRWGVGAATGAAALVGGYLLATEATPSVGMDALVERAIDAGAHVAACASFAYVALERERPYVAIGVAAYPTLLAANALLAFDLSPPDVIAVGAALLAAMACIPQRRGWIRSWALLSLLLLGMWAYDLGRGDHGATGVARIVAAGVLASEALHRAPGMAQR